jgi:hypothetical protein
MAPKGRGDGRGSPRDAAEALARDVASDAIAAARLGYRATRRIGQVGLRLAEKTTRALIDALE